MWVKDWHGLYRKEDWGLVTLTGSETAFEVELLKQAIPAVDTIIELGAGYGTWCLAATGLKRDIRCIAVEAEPTHYKWLCEAFAYNHIEGLTINRVIHDGRKMVLFGTGKSNNWYGQSVIEGASGNWKRVPVWKWRVVQAITLKELLTLSVGRVYINSDIQGSERFVFKDLPEQVTRLHIGTHSAAIHIELRRRLSSDFRTIADYPPGYKDDKLELNDGILELERR